MDWIINLWPLILVGGLPTVLSVTLGVYWLKNERYPWEKEEVEPEVFSDNESS